MTHSECEWHHFSVWTMQWRSERTSLALHLTMDVTKSLKLLPPSVPLLPQWTVTWNCEPNELFLPAASGDLRLLPIVMARSGWNTISNSSRNSLRSAIAGIDIYCVYTFGLGSIPDPCKPSGKHCNPERHPSLPGWTLDVLFMEGFLLLPTSSWIWSK